MIFTKILTNFLGGLSPSLFVGAENEYQLGSGIDVFREPGVLQAGYAQTDLTISELTTAITKFIAPGVSGDTEFVYGYSATQMARYDSFNNVLTNNATWVREHTGGDEGGFGLYRGLLYYANGNTQIGSFTPGATPTFTDNTITGLTAATFRPMHEFDDVLWIGNLNQIAKRSGTTNTLGALTLETGYEIDHIIDWKGFLAFTASKMRGNPTENITTFTKLFLWDTQISKWFEFLIPGETRIRGLKPWRGGLAVLGSNSLQFFNGESFRVLVPFSQSNFTGNTSISFSSFTTVEGLDIWRDYLVWPGTNDIVFYGSRDPRIPDAVMTPLRFGTGSPVGIFGGKENQLLVSGSSTVRLAVYEGGRTTSVTFDTNIIRFEKKVKIKGVRVFFKALTSGDSVAMTYRYRAGTGEASISLGSITFASLGAVSETYLTPSVEPPVSHIYLRFSFDGGAIQFLPNIEIFYEPMELTGPMKEPSPQI